jgi:NAD(P)-dependent dehydrogenase (short-subunit alcohol dehydrogenase family)
MSGKASSVRPRAADDDDDGVGAESSSPSSPSSPSSKIADAVLLSCLVPYTLAFAFFRIAEIFACCLDHGSACVSALLGTIVLSRSSLGRGLRSRCLLHVFSLILGAHVLDRVVPASLPTPSQLPPGRTVVVTGANAGIGYETSRRLAVDYGARVIMGCRSRGRCDEAAAAINAELKERGEGASSSGSATPMLVDLSSFESVESFASILLADDRGTTSVVDVLFNNAGYAPREGEPVNAVGLESSFASMHLGHFYLTELLLRENPRMRVVNTSSGTHHMCAMLSLRGSRRRRGESPGCIDDAFFRNGVRSPSDGLAYVRAKLANAMHAVELPRRHPGATAIAIDLGWVGTSIQPFMRGGFLVSEAPRCLAAAG